MNLKVLKNSSYLLFAQGIIKIFSFLYTLFIAKQLGVESFGLYSVALSYFALVSSLADLGISRYLIRESAKYQEKVAILFTNSLILRIASLSIFYLFFSLALILFDPSISRTYLTLLLTLAAFPQALAFTMDAIFVSKQKLSVSAIGLLVLNLSNFLIGFILISLGFGVEGVIFALILGHIVYTFLLFMFLPKQKLFNSKLINKKVIKEIFFGSYKYGLLAILGLVHFKIDTVILSYLRGTFETGIYGFSYRFLDALMVIPAAVETAIFPMLARMFHLKNDMYSFYRRSLFFMFILSIPVILVFVLVMPFFINTYLPQYKDSILVLKILSLTIPFIFALAPQGGILLVAEKNLKPLLWISLVLLSFNIISNLIFIPKFGYIASAWITVISHIATFIAYILLIQKFTNTNKA